MRDLATMTTPGEPWPGPDEPPSPDGGPRTSKSIRTERSER